MNPPKIQVYCTVREDELEAGPNGLVCTRCIRNLVNLNDPGAASKATGCGFLRRVGAPALASTLLLSACHAKPEARQMVLGKIAPQTESPKPPEKETASPLQPPPRPVLPGLIAPPTPPPPKKDEPQKPADPKPDAPEKKKNSQNRPVADPRSMMLGGLGAIEAHDWPIASSHPGMAGYVTSPYTGKPVDVVSFEAGSLICDPAYPMSARKYFRIMEAV